MPDRQDEPVAAEPLGVSRIMTHHLLMQQIRHRGEADRCTRVAVANLLNSVCREYTCGIYRTIVELAPLQSVRQWPAFLTTENVRREAQLARPLRTLKQSYRQDRPRERDVY